MIIRSRVFALLACHLLGCALLPAQAPKAFESPAVGLRRPGQPNIIFILADDLGYGELGCYGQTKIRTPHLDRLAAQGMRFTQCYAGSTVCAPSRASLLTGLHTGHVRVRGNAEMPLEPEDVTVATMLRSVGYKTGAVGKWGLGLAGSTGHPNSQGFDEWFGYLSQTQAHDYYPTQLFRNDRVITLDENLQGKKGAYSHDLFTKVATNFVRIHRNSPFFLYLAYTIPHAHNELHELGMQVPSDQPYSAENWPQAEKNKAAMISRLDADVGLLMNRLQALGIEEKTLVFFASDNGPHKEGGVNPDFFRSAGPLRGIKRDLYEGGIRIPMIVRWPGHIPAATVSTRVCAFWDFLPTAAEVAGAKVPPGIDGLSILPTLLGRTQTNQHDFLYWEFHENGSKQAVRHGDWKAVRLAPGRPLELYNLHSDPAESNNVAAQHPEVVDTIESYLRSARSESPRWPLQPPNATESPATTAPNPK